MLFGTRKRFALIEGGPRRLIVSCDRHGESLAVRLDGVRLPPTDSTGHYYTLPDGSSLAVHVLEEGGSTDFGLVVDGRHLPGTFFNPHTRIRSSAFTLFCLALASLLVQSEKAAAVAPFLSALPLVPMSLGGAVLFGALGVTVLRHSRLAAWLGALLGAIAAAAFAAPLFFSEMAGVEVWLAPLGIFWLVHQAVPGIDELHPRA